MAYLRILVGTAFAALLTSATGVAAQSNLQSPGRIIDQAVAHVPACVGLAIGATQADMHVQRFYGSTGRRVLPTADTIFGIGSITKTLTATVLAHEAQSGTMHLDEPLAHYAPPGFPVPDFNGQPILLSHLAEHTSGLPRIVPNPSSPMPPERLWRFTGNYQLSRAPGAQFLYSNLGFALLARAIVRKSHATEDQLYARIISGPLGLHDTSIDLTPAQRARLAQGFRPNGEPAPEFGPGFPAMAGAGAARSTLNDMMRYLDFQLGRVNIPLRALLPALHQPRHAAGPGRSVGLAWQIKDGGKSRVIFKGGTMPGYEAFMAFAPSQGTGVVVLSNQAGCAVAKIASQIMHDLNGTAEQDPLSSDSEGQL